VLKVSLRPSWILAAILAAAHGAAIAVIALVSVPLWLQLIAIAALAVNLVFEIRQTVLLRAPDAVVALEIASDDALSIQTRRGDWIECEVLGSTYVTYFLAIVNLKDQGSGRVKRAVILPDSIDAEDFRKLRVWLRWKAERRPT
jgi:toxin CptA